MPTPDVNVARMLDVLDRHRVEYVIIGGFAIELHDVAVPPTRDVDLTPDTGGANLRRLATALTELDAHFRVPGGPPEGVPVPGGISAEWLAEFVTITMTTAAGPLDVSLRPDGTEGYVDLIRSHVVVEFEGRPVRIASLEDVIRSKEAAGRSKDFIVLPALRAHLERRQR